MAEVLTNVMMSRESLSDHTKLVVLRAISFAFGWLSLGGVLFAYYWFHRMRRSFRHELIMLLLQSDLLKSACYIVFPLVQSFRGPVPNRSAFCQATGFFLTVGIEASDIAALMLAIHATISVIYASRQGRDWSLYKYRGVVYGIYTAFPLVMASLAFINDGPAFEDVGAYCYLRLDRSWPRMALSWIPRYVIGGFILISYFCLYIFVICRLRVIRRPYGNVAGRGSASRNRHGHLVTRPLKGVPPVPRLAYNGLIESPAASPRRQSDLSTLIHGASNLSPLNVSHERVDETTVNVRAHVSVTWAQPSTSVPQEVHIPASRYRSLNFGGPFDTTAQQHNYVPDIRLLDSHRNSHPHHGSLLFGSQEFKLAESDSLDPGKRVRSLLSVPSFRRRSSSLANILASLRITSSPPSDSNMPPSLSLYDPYNNMKYRVHETRHQVRLQFIYPFVYVLMWIFPFISHVKNFDNAYSMAAPIWLYALSMASMSAQGLVDALLFCFREYPWRHKHTSFCEGVKRRWKIRAGWFRAKKPGRTREERIADGRFAMMRRNAEIEDRRRMRSDETGRATVLQTRGGEDWWNAYDSDDDRSGKVSSKHRSSSV